MITEVTGPIVHTVKTRPARSSLKSRYTPAQRSSPATRKAAGELVGDVISATSALCSPRQAHDGRRMPS